MILHYAGPDDFAVELKTRSAGDRLLLAKVPPEPTLQTTIDKVLKRWAAGPPQTASLGDILMVPRLDFDITRQFTELHGRLAIKNPQLRKDLQILSALENVHFEMNEKGVKLRSEAHIAIGCGGEAPPRCLHSMIFDKPFLLLLERTDAKTPYFALWVGNPEILASTGSSEPNR